MLSHLSICIRVWWPLKVPHPLTTHRICIQQGPVWYQVCLRCFSRQKNPNLLKHLQRVYCKWLNPMLLWTYFWIFWIFHSETLWKDPNDKPPFKLKSDWQMVIGDTLFAIITFTISAPASAPPASSSSSSSPKTLLHWSQGSKQLQCQIPSISQLTSVDANVVALPCFLGAPLLCHTAKK